MLSPPPRFRYEDDLPPSEVIAWYNQNADPAHVGSYRAISGAHGELKLALDACFEHLPVDLEPIFDYVYEETDLLVQGDILERLLVMVFNEEDGRISSNASKEQVLAILTFLLQHPGTSVFTSRQIRVRIRIALQKVQVWIDELQPAEDVFSDFVSIFHSISLWRLIEYVLM